MGKIANALDTLKPTILMVLFQASMAGVNIFYKLAASDGMSLRILIAYRFLFAAGFIVPIALVVERKIRPKLTLATASQGFFSGLLTGTITQNLYAQSLVLTSATFAAAMVNLIPAATFVLAVIFKLERLAWRTDAGKAKVLGTILCIGGAMVLTFYKGKEINLWSTRVDLLHGHVAQHESNQVLGAILLVICCLSNAAGLITQAKMMKNYPCPYSTAALMMTSGSIQSIIFALFMDSRPSSWRLGWNIRLLSTLYGGIVGGGVSFTLMAWCVQKRGPVFVSVFNPLMLVLVAISGSLLLNEKLHLGSVIGGVVIVCGLYMVLWGKGKELKRIIQLLPSKSSMEAERGLEIVVTYPTEDSNNISRSTSSIAVGDFPNATPVVFGDDIFHDDVVVPEKYDPEIAPKEEGEGAGGTTVLIHQNGNVS